MRLTPIGFEGTDKNGKECAMAKKKSNFYAVKAGIKPGIYSSWEECKAQVEGYKGCQYKGFRTKREAEAYMTDEPGIFDPVARKPPSRLSDVTIYVDGSFDPDTGIYGYGYVALLPNGTEEKFCGAGNSPEPARLRNVAGEMLAAMHAVKYAMKRGYQSVKLCYDYAGIECWATGVWKANNVLTAQYANAMKRWSRDIEISFCKIAAHTNVKYNEMADRLARQGVASFVK